MLQFAYVTIIDDFKSRILSDRQIIATCIAAGAKDLELPDIDEEKRKFDKWLSSPPEEKKAMPDNDVLLTALGLRR